MGIVFGGISSEHEISCATAAGVLAAIDRARFDVVPIGIAKDSSWVLVADDPEPLRIQGTRLPRVESAGQAGVALAMARPAGRVLTSEPGQLQRELARLDVVLPLLHGPFGEDGTLQGLLELADLPYVGSGVLASAAGMDKSVAKTLLAAAGIRVAPQVLITRTGWERERESLVEEVCALGDVVFVKPTRAGSSMGVSRVDLREGGRHAVVHAIEEARRHDPKVIVEAAVDGREVEVAVLQGRGSERPRTSGLGEIGIGGDHAFYDFEAKYTDTSSTSLHIPADVPAELASQARELAARAFEALDCEGLARVDFFLTSDGLVLNEVNTMPGFTPFSMFPQLWAHEGLDYTALITELLELALARPRGLR